MGSVRRWSMVFGVVVCGALAAPAAAGALAPGDILVSDYRAFGGDGGLIAVNPASGARSTVSANDAPPGTPHFDGSVAIAFEPDGDILVAQDGSGADFIPQVLRVDPATGTRATVSSNTVGTGPELECPNGLALEPDGDILLADLCGGEDFNGAIVRIDPVTGNRTTVSSNSVGTGLDFESPATIELEPGGTILVLDTYSALLRVDPATGNRTTVSSDSVGSGPTFEYAYGLELEPGGTALVGDSGGLFTQDGAILRVNLATGNRTTVSSNTVGTGPSFYNPSGLYRQPDGQILVGEVGTSNAVDGSVLRVDPATGNRTTVSSNASPTGDPLLADPYELAIVPAAASPYPGVIDADNPAGYWRFGEPSGLTALDSSANGNDGTYLNGPVLGVPGALANDPDTAVRLDGVNDTVRVPDDNTLDVGDTFTAEGWIKRSSTTQAHTMMVKGFQITVMGAANGNQVWLRKPNVSTIARSNAGVGAGAYHHVAVTKNGTGPGAVKIYIDGAPVTVVDVAPALAIQNTATNLTFGSAGSTPADFDEFALYDQVLTPAQIAEHYDAGAPSA